MTYIRDLPTKNRIRWVLAHEPIELFLRAAEHFAAVLKDNAPHFRVEVMTLSQYSDRYAGGKAVTKHDLKGLVDDGKIEMSQMYTTWLGESDAPNMRALDMPYLFQDHAHASRVLDGSIGLELLKSMKGGSHGLAFTYSGGFRMIPAVEPIRDLDEMRGKRVRVSRSPVAFDTALALGADPVTMELEDIRAAVQSGAIRGGESTYPRFYGLAQNEVCPHINDTGHSLFLTAIIASRKFWEPLGSRDKWAILMAARSAAQYERKISVEDVGLVRARAKREGIAVHDFRDTEVAKGLTGQVYDKWTPAFGDLVQRIAVA